MPTDWFIEPTAARYPCREGALADPTLREKEKLHRREKLRIAEAAAAMVQKGQVVILDSGTTTTAIAGATQFS